MQMNVGGGGSRKPVACRTLALNKCNKKEDRGSETVSFCDLCFKTQLHTEISFLGGMR